MTEAEGFPNTQGHFPIHDQIAWDRSLGFLQSIFNSCYTETCRPYENDSIHFTEKVFCPNY